MIALIVIPSRGGFPCHKMPVCAPDGMHACVSLILKRHGLPVIIAHVGTGRLRAQGTVRGLPAAGVLCWRDLCPAIRTNSSGEQLRQYHIYWLLYIRPADDCHFGTGQDLRHNAHPPGVLLQLCLGMGDMHAGMQPAQEYETYSMQCFVSITTVTLQRYRRSSFTTPRASIV